MRLDKFLKVSRIIKRRTIAKKIADQGRILVNGKEAKSSTKVAPGDELTIKFGNKTTVLKIDQVEDTTKEADAADLYTLIKEEYAEDFSLDD